MSSKKQTAAASLEAAPSQTGAGAGDAGRRDKIAFLSNLKTSATGGEVPAPFLDWLRDHNAASADKLLPVDVLGRVSLHGALGWNGASGVAACSAAIAVASAAPGLDSSIKQFFATMSRWGLRKGLLVLLPMGADNLSAAAASAALWSAKLEEFTAFATGLAFEQLDVLPLDCVGGDAVGRSLDWFEDARVVQLMQAQGAGGEAGPLRFEVVGTDGAPESVVDVVHRSGALANEMDLVLLPDAVRVAATMEDSTDTQDAFPSSLTLQLKRQLAAKAGQVLAPVTARPEVADQLAAHLIWSGEDPMLPGRPYVALLNGQRAVAQISTLKHKLDVDNLEHIAADKLVSGEIGYCNLSLDAAFVFDRYEECRDYGLIEIRDKESGLELGVALISHELRRATNIHWQAQEVDQSARAALKGQQPCCLWFTGLSGSGKSTVASLLEKRLQSLGRHTYTLDGDNVRHGLNRDLGFTDVDRVENIRRIGEVSKLFVDAGLIVMCSFISPFRAERRMVRNLFGPGEFIEIFVDTPLEICESRDIKGLYKKARAGALKNFTGIDSPYEPPEHAELTIAAGVDDPDAMVETLLSELQRRGVV